MIKKCLSMFLLLIILSMKLSGQDFSISIGANHSWFYYHDAPPLENDFNPGYSLGISFNQNIFPDINLSTGLRFFNVGRYNEISLFSITERVDINHTYMTLPVKIEYQLFNNFYPFVNIEPGIQLQSDFEHTNSFGLNDKKTITDEMNRFNLFTGIGFKYLFNIYNHKISVSSLINFGLLRISKDEQFDVTDHSSRGWIDWKARELLVNFEYYFRL